MDHRLPATREMAQEFSELFVNRRAYTLQSDRPHAESGRHYYFRPTKTPGPQPDAGHPPGPHRGRNHHRPLCHQPGHAAV